MSYLGENFIVFVYFFLSFYFGGFVLLFGYYFSSSLLSLLTLVSVINTGNLKKSLKCVHRELKLVLWSVT